MSCPVHLLSMKDAVATAKCQGLHRCKLGKVFLKIIPFPGNTSNQKGRASSGSDDHLKIILF